MLDTTSDSRASTNLNPAEEASTKEVEKSYAVEKIVGHDSQRTGLYYTVRWYGYGPRRIRSSPPNTLPTIIERLIGEGGKSINIDTCLEDDRNDQRKNTGYLK